MAISLTPALSHRAQRARGRWSARRATFIESNDLELAATDSVMLLALFLLGAGRSVSADNWIARPWRTRSAGTQMRGAGATGR